ncbi:leucine-rich repeat serine/threonine-protein kinase 1-like isoform X2 [Paramacrobiotus metropolitanus]|uniref:leucine-rich repeat serine/threonine-protein kinase 1-like isoform X2 n=1 Tax=Paramacrobiotus metropolitanus TaxID=2943436 RepID=UPI00244638B5|nr:leucine-rich repeat serine/threonine-protein kinase 1-like isoform X2 [Paramacrobiotus metropolitanus]
MAENDFPGRLLHQACVWENAELLEDLLKNGEEAKNIDSEDRYGRTPLHAAAKSGNLSLVGVLLNAGADPNVQSSIRAGAETPLHIAAYHGRLEAVACLLSSGASVHTKNSRAQTPLDVAMERRQRDCVEMLRIYQEAKAERLAVAQKEFLEAFGRDDIIRMETILEATKSDSSTLVNSIVVDGVPLLTRAVMKNNAEVVKLLLKSGADANIETAEGSALYEAVFRGNSDIAEMLIERAPGLVSKPNGLGWLPLHVAINLQHRSIVDLLLNSPLPDDIMQPYLDISMTWNYRMGFDINALTADNQSPLYLAVETGNIRLVEQLIAKKVPAWNEKGETKDFSPLHLDLVNYNGETALYAAIKAKHSAIVKLLLERGADPNLALNVGNPVQKTNVLAAAVRNCDTNMAEVLMAAKAEDKGCCALSTAAKTDVETALLVKMLALHAHRDTEFKINKKLMELASAKGIKPLSGASGAMTYSTIFPTVPVAIIWQNATGLDRFDEAWLLHSAIALNPKIVGRMGLFAITKLDVSYGDIEELPTCVFRLQSLRTLNASNNRICRFQPLDLCRNSSACQCPVLQDVNLSHNDLTVAPDDLFYFPSLSHLDLSHNSITTLPFAMWQAPALKDLNLSNNMLEALPIKSDKSLPFAERSTSIMERLSSDASLNDSSLSPAVMVQPVHRNNLWSSRLIVEAVKSVEVRSDKQELALKILNLAHNALSSIPLGLCCLAPNLAKLVVSGNALETMGIIQDYPAGLKHLDASNNHLEVSLRPGTADEMDNVCYFEDSSWHKGKRVVSLLSDVTCTHRKHWKLENLRTLTVAKNRLMEFEVAGGPPVKRGSRSSSGSGGLLDNFSSSGTSLLYPNLSVLDLSDNKLFELPEALSNMTNLSVLNFEGNRDIADIPPQLGLLSKLWTLNANGCNLADPLKSMFESKQYKSADILGYLKSLLENCQPYTRMKLMVVGLENKGKTSLLRALKSEESHRKSRSSESNWTQRMGHRGDRKGGIQMSTVGIDLGEWTCSDGQHEVTFRTWDFAGQREYYATHQYFLSRRSLYLVVWNMLDGISGINEVTQWLVNIQARAPSSPVIIVGTHLDEVKGAKFSPGHVENLKSEVRQRFMGVIDADKHGLPRVVNCVEISCKTKQNVSQLAKIIVETAWDLRQPGTNKRLMEQQIPAIYIALEDLVSALAFEYRESGQHPVVSTEYFRAIVAHELHERFSMTFRDSSELRQAVMFLHDNGILLHYEDSSGLRDLYFIDPQWLCDTLATVITIREINPFVRKGVMKIDDLKVLFKPSKYALVDVHTYILSLLNKFEVALKLDARTLLIPCLLPVKSRANGDRDVPLKIEIKSSGRNWIHFKPFLDSPEEPPVKVEGVTVDKGLQIRRYYTMLYFPSGFWARLISRLVSDEKFFRDVRNYYLDENQSNLTVEWLCWQNAMELCYGDHSVLRIREIPSSRSFLPFVHLCHDRETSWKHLHLDNKAVMEISLLVYRKNDMVITNLPSVSMLLNRCVNHIDSLLEDWYPSLGTRFIHTSTGQYLVTKFIPCPQCVAAWKGQADVESEKVVRAFSVEQIIYKSVTGCLEVVCAEHGNVKIADIAPETMFLDLPPDKLMFPGDLKRGRILGRGAFGFVYRATVKPNANRVSQDVAIKMLLPVDPGFNAEASVVSAYKSVMQQWEHEPVQSYCKAYWTARQELSILTTLSHHHIVGLVGLCLQPLGIVLQLAPKGSLLDHVKSLRQNNEQMPALTVQMICIQITKALEYLHGFRIIYRDLKSDNVLVWSLDKKVLVKLTDYGISRVVTAASTTKGFAGTEAYIAPEIIQYGGEEEYNEGVDIFSFGMLMYELLTLHQPFEGQDQIKDFVLDGGRPAVVAWTLQYPSLMLDLLVVAWSQLSRDRPTASQALSICNTPEYGHLQDVAVLEDVSLNIAVGGVVSVPDGVGIVLADGSVNIVSATGYKWLDCKTTSLPSSDAVTNCLVTHEFVWVLRGKDVSVFCAKTLDLTETFRISFGGPLQEADIDAWVYVPDRQRVVISLASKRLLVMNVHASLRKNKLVEAFCSVTLRLNCLCAAGKDMVVGGGESGQMMIINVRDEGIAEDCIVDHVSGEKKVADVMANWKEGLAWTYLEDDATLFCWALLKPRIVHKLDCDRLIPVSESLNSIVIEETQRDETKRTLCCMTYWEGLVYVGTVWGSLIIVKGDTLAPLTIIRPHVDRVVGLGVLKSPDGARLVSVGRGYRDVVGRFFPHDNVRMNVSPMTLCAVMWRMGEWALL